MMGGVLGDSMDLEFVREFLLGDWQEGPDCSDELDPWLFSSVSNHDSSSSQLSDLLLRGTSLGELKNRNQTDPEGAQEEPVDNFSGNPSWDYESGTSVEHTRLAFVSEHKGGSLAVESTSYGSSVRERLACALNYIRESIIGGEILVQIWTPVRVGSRRILSTSDQPFIVDSDCQRLVNYRLVSTRYQFAAEESSEHALGLPGRVFVGKLPEWTPDVRFFRSFEYPRVDHAQLFDVRGSIALPVFEREGCSCLGVVEVVMTTEKINYCSDLDNICKALQAVNLRSSDSFNIYNVKVKNYNFQAALPDISKVLRIACEKHKLPLAQTWIPCIQQGRRGSRHNSGNYKNCISTVDRACYINDPCVSGFHEACSEHHLFKGQGVVGKAFATNQPCFVSDITALHRTEYPLAHIARLFNLRSAVAIRLRSFHAGTTDFVLEFFLSVECAGSEEQKLLLNSLSGTIHQVSQSLRVVMVKELEEEGFSCYCNSISGASCGDMMVCETIEQPTEDQDSAGVLTMGTTSTANLRNMANTSKIPLVDERIFPAHSQHAERELPGTYLEANCKEEIVFPVHHSFSEVNLYQQNSVPSSNHDEYSVALCNGPLETQMTSEKKHAKGEKAISLQHLQQYFTGSLKDASKILGVCPTTLKRICRQHGITRWPSRKFKKVSHSLKKLQVIIDSVEGVDKSYQFSSLYANKLASPMTGLEFSHDQGDIIFSSLKQSTVSKTLDAPFVYDSTCTSTSNSLSPSCSHDCSSRSHSSSEASQGGNAHQFVMRKSLKDGQDTASESRKTEMGLHASAEGRDSRVAGSYNQRFSALCSPGIQPSLPENRCHNDQIGVKVTCGDERVRFKLQPDWGLQDLKQKIAERFSIDDPSLVELKYLDDDSDKVLLTCDADFLECINVYKSSNTRAIKIYAHHITQH